MKRKSTTAKALSKKQFLNLSPEQMFAAYSAERQAKAEAEERAERENCRAEREKNRADKAETIISTIRRLHAEAYKVCADISGQARKRYGNVDEILSLEIVDLVKYTLEEWRQWILVAKSYLRETPMGRQGPDIKKEKAAAREDEKAASGESAEERKKLAAGQKTMALLRRGRDAIRSAIKSMKDTPLSKAQQAVADIDAIALPEKELGAAPRSGRLVKDRKADVQTAASFGENGNRCRVCGGETVSLDEGIKDEIVTMSGMLNTLAQFAEQKHELRLCEKCGHVSFAVSDDQDLPVCPGREVGLNTVVTFTEGLCIGMPLHRISSLLKDLYSIGNDTFYYSCSDFAQIYVRPLYELILQSAREADVIVADGTPFSCMEAQGRRECKKYKELKKNGSEPPDPSSKNYILAVTSGPAEKKKFTIYFFLRSRSSKNIASVLKDGWKFSTLVTDAYSGYDSLVAEPGRPVVQQNCLIHFRRTIAKAIDPETWTDEMLAIDEKRCREVLSRDFREESPRFMLYYCLNAISKIYRLESLAGCHEGYYPERIEEARKTSLGLMDKIDGIMKTLSVKHTKTGERGGVQAEKGDPYGQPCVYWQNNADKLRLFLDHPDVPPDSSCVERAIRPLTLYRTSVSWKAGVEGMEEMCMVYTLYNTCRGLGMSVRDFDSWLKAYSRSLYRYCLEKHLTRILEETGRISIRGVPLDMKELSEGFDFEVWNPMTAEGRAHR